MVRVMVYVKVKGDVRWIGILYAAFFNELAPR